MQPNPPTLLDAVAPATRCPAEPRRMLLPRLAAGGALLLGITLSHRLALLGDGDTSRAVIFVTLLAVGGGVSMFTHALGRWIGAGVGVTTGLSAAIALTAASDSPGANGILFSALAAAVCGTLGYLSGRRGGGSRLCLNSLRDPGRRAGEPMPTHDACGGIASDFCYWLRGFVDADEPADSPARTDDSGGPSWSDFDQFLRHTLRQRLGAAGVRAFNLSADGETLSPLSCRRSPARRREAPADGAARHDGVPRAHDGLVGRIVEDGEVFVARDPQSDGYCDVLAQVWVRNADGPSDGRGAAAARGWKWLLPLRHHGRVRAVVGIARLGGNSNGAPDRSVRLARDVRELLEAQWAYMHDVQALQVVVRTDRQSGMLGRADLLMHLRRAADESGRDGEPLMVLALAVEGLRRLDDSGGWEQRDALIERFAVALRDKVRSDDALGRFSDDRFVAVLRRLDQGLGRRIAEKLIETAREAIGSAGGITVRAGLAGGRGESIGGDQLLERSLQLVDLARQRGLDLATESATSRRPGGADAGQTVAATPGNPA